MRLQINPGDELPIYRQIMRQITEAIAGNRLRAGDKLASHRDLAEQLVIAPLTVKKAYDELEREGFIRTQRGRGTFVAEKRPEKDGALQQERLRESARRIAAQAWLGNIPIETLLEVVRDEHRKLEHERGKETR